MGRLTLWLFGDVTFRELRLSSFPFISVALFVAYTLTLLMMLINLLLGAISEVKYNCHQTRLHHRHLHPYPDTVTST